MFRRRRRINAAAPPFRRRPAGRALALSVAFAVLSAAWTDGARAEPRVVVFGDSLTAGFGVDAEDGFAPRLAAWLAARDASAEIVNASVSGDTTAMGRARLDWALGGGADAILISLGANDMLRGIDPRETRANLDAMLRTAADREIEVLLAGMRASGNLGVEYQAAFDSIYPTLAAEYGALLHPFLLDGVALEPSLNQPDGIHPNAKGVLVIVEGIGPLVLELLKRAQAGDQR